MPHKPLLSVAVVVQNQRDVLELTLTSLFELSHIPIELFLIDDASTDGSENVIQSLLDYYQHEHTFYYRHQRPVGRANALNEILPQCNSPLFWAPETISEIDEQQLKRNITQLTNTNRVAMVEQKVLPETHDQWIELIQHQTWVQDGSFIWNLGALSPANQFFNPYIKHFHSMELSARLGDGNLAVSNERWHRQHTSPEPDFPVRQEMLLTILRNTEPTGPVRQDVLQRLFEIDDTTDLSADREFEHRLLNEAMKMKQNGRFNAALEVIEQVLQDEPHHTAARELKIEILEKKRRFVEASELKHEVENTSKPDPKPQPAPSSSTLASDEPVSIIIPTTTYGKPALENCLVSISEACSHDQLELIIIDNASLDDTHDYLKELKEKQFLNCKVITNEQNRGFAASVNQGLQQASGSYACIMHNDVELNSDVISLLAGTLEDNPEYALVGPLTNKTLNPDQHVQQAEAMDFQLTETDYIDSFLMMLRTDLDLAMDKAYELAFFEDVDLCFQARSEGYKVGIVPEAEVTHHFGTTTLDLDLDTDSEQYWKNVSYFNEKWNIELFSEQELKSLNTFDQLLALDDLVNPLFPEEEIKQQYERLFTDELRTEILKARHEPETLCKLVHLFMVMDEREIMRHFEDHLEEVKLPASLIYQLVRFYFKRNIYSRCRHYLDQLQPEQDTLRADLYRLAIHIENKELNQAIPMLKELLNEAPANPSIYKLTGDIHKFKGNEEEAVSFYSLAEQINPFEYANEQKDAFGFEL